MQFPHAALSDMTNPLSEATLLRSATKLDFLITLSVSQRICFKLCSELVPETERNSALKTVYLTFLFKCW